jgi:hypothetical protein
MHRHLLLLPCSLVSCTLLRAECALPWNWPLCWNGVGGTCSLPQGCEEWDAASSNAGHAVTGTNALDAVKAAAAAAAAAAVARGPWNFLGGHSAAVSAAIGQCSRHFHDETFFLLLLVTCTSPLCEGGWQGLVGVRLAPVKAAASCPGRLCVCPLHSKQQSRAVCCTERDECGFCNLKLGCFSQNHRDKADSGGPLAVPAVSCVQQQQHLVHELWQPGVPQTLLVWVAAIWVWKQECAAGGCPCREWLGGPAALAVPSST